MSTRSLIGRARADGAIDYVYCHYDGYPDGVGTTLLAHWTDPARLDALIALGDLSILGSEIGEQHHFDRWAMTPEEKAKVEPWCLFYGRDRKETDCGFQVADDRHAFAAANSGTDYQYLLTQDGWLVHGRRFEWRPLEDVLNTRLSA